MSIPEAAVQAGANYLRSTRWMVSEAEAATVARRTLEAAAPHMHRIINSADELDALPEGSVVLDYEDDVSQKRGGMWCGYETAPLNSHRLARLAGPFTVLREPAGE